MNRQKKHSNLKLLHQKKTQSGANRLDGEKHLLREESERLASDSRLLNETLHEVRKLNNQIKALIEQLKTKIQIIQKGPDDGKTKEIENIFKTLQANTSLLSIRMNAYDAIFNPEILAKDMCVPLNVYSKVEKVYKCLYAAKKEKGVSVNLLGNSNQTFLLNNTVELAFFIIIENAIKYSYPTSNIDICFLPDSWGTTLDVEFKNWGLRPAKADMPRLAERGFRSDVAKASKIPGSGLGLYILQKICAVNKIEHDIHLLDECHFYEGCKYSPFVVTLHFRNQH